MQNKIAKMLDGVADRLEIKGLIKEAQEIDKIADIIEGYTFPRKITAKEKNLELRKAVIKYFSNPKAELNDKKGIHALAKELKVDESILEEEIYRTLHDILGAGKFVESKGKVKIDPEELKKGIKIEQEHTPCKIIAERIAKDHLTEFGDYYTRLEKMEKEAEKK